MGDGGETCWSRSYEGRDPSNVLFTGAALACSYIADQGEPMTSGKHTVVRLDLAGGEQWSARDFQLEVALPDERLLGVTHGGELRVLDARGRKAEGIRDGRKRVACKQVESIIRRGDRIMVRSKRDIVLTDSSLEIIDRMPVPPAAGAIVVGDHVLYVDRSRLMRLDRRGCSEVIVPALAELVCDAMDRWEREMGIAALAGVAFKKFDPAASESENAAARPSVLGIGDRLEMFVWRLGYLEATNTLFVANGTHPHVLLCIGLDGVVRWSSYLDSACCGGTPELLPNGELVVSSGCGRILSWLDPASGRVLRRSLPADGMFSSSVRALDDGSAVIDGESYGADGLLRWRWPEASSCFDYDHQWGLLVTATWKLGPPKTISIECVKGLANTARA